MPELHIVTGAFGYSGQLIAQGLLERGHRVRTLTNSPHRPSPLQGKIEVAPLCFDDREALVESLRGATVLYNTYWVRFDHRSFTHRKAVENTRKLFLAAREAGVSRIVHVSITRPSLTSPLPYFSGKAELEQALGELGVPHTILRPAVLFGGADILINNIAWALRTLPVFGVFGDGSYGLRPIHVADFAELAIRSGTQSGDQTIDAVGPESFTFRELATVIGEIIGCRRPVIGVPIWFGYLVARLVGRVMHDVFLTREEIAGLSAGLLESDAPSTGNRRLTDWAREHRNQLGRLYASEMRRRRDRLVAYRSGKAAAGLPADISIPEEIQGSRKRAKVWRWLVIVILACLFWLTRCDLEPGDRCVPWRSCPPPGICANDGAFFGICAVPCSRTHDDPNTCNCPEGLVVTGLPYGAYCLP